MVTIGAGKRTWLGRTLAGRGHERARLARHRLGRTTGCHCTRRARPEWLTGIAVDSRLRSVRGWLGHGFSKERRQSEFFVLGAQADLQKLKERFKVIGLICRTHMNGKGLILAKPSDCHKKALARSD